LSPSRPLKLIKIQALWLALLVLVCLAAGLPVQADAAAPAEILEELHYRLSVSMWRDAVRAKVVLQRLGPGRYRAEISGVAQGSLATMSGNWRGSFSTEMVYRDGKLFPLIYREESQRRDKRNFKEYRYDYENRRIELWTWHKGKGLLKKWESTFTEPPNDGVSFFYNYRLGNLGPLKEGQKLKLNGIPYPRKDDITISVGPQTDQGQKIMISLASRVFEKENFQIYAMFDAEGVITHAWTHVSLFGKVTGDLLPGGKRLTEKKLE